MQRAVVMYRLTDCTVEEAANEHDVSPDSLRYKLKRTPVGQEHTVTMLKPGPKLAIPVAHEHVLCDQIAYRGRMRVPLNKRQLRAMVYAYALFHELDISPAWHDGHASSEWLRGFLERNKDRIRVKRSRLLPGHRAMFATQVCVEIFNSYHMWVELARNRCQRALHEDPF